MIGYEFECFSFLFIAVLFSAGNAKKNVFTVFIDPIVTIDAFLDFHFVLPRCILPIVAIGTVKTVKTFFFAFPALNSTGTAMTKKLKHSNSYRHKM